MPDFGLYFLALAAAAGASALVVVLVSWLSSAGRIPASFGGVLACAVGLAIGYSVLHLRVRWPPANGLDRFLTILLPAVVVIEGIAAWERVPRWLAWLLRLALIAAGGRILLHGSIYLGPQTLSWKPSETAAALTVGSALVAGLWAGLVRLSKSAPATSLVTALSLTLLAAGLTIMLAGYVTGGAATIPPAAALMGIAAISGFVKPKPDLQAAIGIGVVSLAGLLFLGRFFGGLTSATCLVILLAPLLTWLVEFRLLRPNKNWLVEPLRVAFVVIPLIAVVVIAKRKFDRDTRPLLAEVQQIYSVERVGVWPAGNAAWNLCFSRAQFSSENEDTVRR